MRDTVEMVIDCPDRRRLADFFAAAAKLAGEYTFTARPSRQSVSQKQRGYYHGHVVEVFARFVQSTGQPLPDGFDSYHDFAHAMLKQRNLMHPVYSADGEVVGHVVGSTSALTTEQMSDYTERCRQYLWDRYELMTMEPDPNWRMKREAVRA